MDYDFEQGETGLYEEDAAQEELSVPVMKKQGKRGLLLVMLQLFLCVLCIVFAVTVKLIGGSFHAQTATWFYENYRNSIFTGESGSIIPFSDEVSVVEKNIAGAVQENSRQ